MDDKSNMVARESLTLVNRFPTPVQLHIEPWGVQILLPSNQPYQVVATGPAPTCLRVEFQSTRFVVYGWPGSTLTVARDGQTIVECSVSVPPIPKGMHYV
jgi:hypothetical protein